MTTSLTLTNLIPDLVIAGVIILFVMMVGCSLLSPSFLSSRNISNILKQVSRSGMEDAGQIAQIGEEHRAICEAILDGRAKDARAAMRSHMDNSRERYSYS